MPSRSARTTERNKPQHLTLTRSSPPSLSSSIMGGHLFSLCLFLVAVAASSATESRRMRSMHASTQVTAPEADKEEKDDACAKRSEAAEGDALWCRCSLAHGTIRTEQPCSNEPERQGICRFVKNKKWNPRDRAEKDGKCVPFDFVSSKRVTIFIIGGGFQVR